MSEPIYKEHDRERVTVDVPSSAIWEPPAEIARLPASPSLPSAVLPSDLETKLLWLLTRPIGPGETCSAGNARREHELRALLSQFTAIQSLQLGQRLDREQVDDPVAQAFKRLVVDRRMRLRSFVADARRRLARG